MCIVCRTEHSMVVVSPRAPSTEYVNRKMEVTPDYSGPTNITSKLYFMYTDNPNITDILPRTQIITLVGYNSYVEM